MLASTSQIINRGHAEVLGPMVEGLFASTNVHAKDLAKISVCTGPGSFTGLRVGLSFAKGLALPWELPIVGISGLDVWACMVDPEQEKNVMTIADVRRGEAYWQRFERGQAPAAPVLSDVDTAQKALKPGDIIAGNGAALLGSPEQGGVVSPTCLSWIGLERSVVTHPAEPLYHRPPDAKLPGGRSL